MLRPYLQKMIVS